MKNRKSPHLFDEFFASGQQESISPFLTQSGRVWGKNLPLKSALLSAVLLLLAYLLTFTAPQFSALPLLFVYAFCGTPALLDAIEDIKEWDINIDILMTLAALTSVILGSPMEGALLLVLFELSAAMELGVAHKTKSTLADLQELSPQTAYVLEEGEVVERSVREITPGMHLLIKAGEVVPLDSKVISGQSMLHVKHLTGESLPLVKSIGDEIPGGARNIDGILTVQVVRASGDSTLARIIRLITAAHEAKPRLEKFFDKFGRWYAMGIITLCGCFALFLPWIFGLPFLGEEGSVYRSLAFLIAASPCALIIAMPTAYLSAINACAKRGILLKGGVVLDALTQCRTIAFDKTGTLTSGELVCSEILPLLPSDISLDEAIQLAHSLESGSTHPIAIAICQLAIEKKLSRYPLNEFCSFPGRGLEAMIDGRSVSMGSWRFIQERLPKDSIEEQLRIQERWEGTGSVAAFLLIDQALFLFLFRDELRLSAKECIDGLKRERGLKVIMLSGDRKGSAMRIGQQLGIEDIASELQPEDKLALVGRLSQEGGLIMVGDGINDAPALARATVGIALGKIGSATAIDAADVVLMNDDLVSLKWLLEKAHHTLRIVRQNLSLALGVICCVVGPALCGWVPLWLAVVLHEGGTVLVGLNSLRLLRK